MGYSPWVLQKALRRVDATTDGRIKLSGLVRYAQGVVPVLLQSLQNTFAREWQIADRLADDMPYGIG